MCSSCLRTRSNCQRVKAWLATISNTITTKQRVNRTPIRSWPPRRARHSRVAGIAFRSHLAIWFASFIPFPGPQLLAGSACLVLYILIYIRSRSSRPKACYPNQFLLKVRCSLSGVFFFHQNRVDIVEVGFRNLHVPCARDRRRACDHTVEKHLFQLSKVRSRLTHFGNVEQFRK